jgi:hypothetical protein
MEDGDPTPSEKRSSPKWCPPPSVLDLDFDSLPSPPVALYLREVLFGLQGGWADWQQEGRAGSLTSQVRNLESLLIDASHVAVPVCTALFWMGIGIVFGRMRDDVLHDLRQQLAQNWYLLCLEATKMMSKDQHARSLPKEQRREVDAKLGKYRAKLGDRSTDLAELRQYRAELAELRQYRAEAHDWCLAALPFVFAQAHYRMLYDSFVEDRKHFVCEAEKLIDKLSLVVHFEVTGFQITNDTVHKERRKLFLSRVLVNPHQDLFEEAQSRKREQMLETQNAMNKDMPLAFGSQDNKPLEETQLDHVMQGRADARVKQSIKTPTSPERVSIVAIEPASPTQRRSISLEIPHSEDQPEASHRSPDSAPRSAAHVLEDLSVDRYEKLSHTGEAMWGRHLKELAEILGQESDVGGGEDGGKRTGGANADLMISTQELGEDIDPESGSQGQPSCVSTPKGGKTSPPNSPGSAHRKSSMTQRPRPAPINTSASSTLTRSMTAAPLIRITSETKPGSTAHSGRHPPGQREPLVREPPRNITIGGNQVQWPAKSPPKKRPPLPGPWDNLQAKHSEESGGTESVVEDAEAASPLSGKKWCRTKKKVQTMGKMAAMFSHTGESSLSLSKQKRLAEAEMRRKGQEAVHRKIAIDPLPQDVCEHELYTTWVSPVMTRVATETDPLSVLRKTRAESRQCKMQVQTSLLRPSSKDGISSASSSPRAAKSVSSLRGFSRGGQTSDGRGASRNGQLSDDLGETRAPLQRSGSRGAPRSMKAASWGTLPGTMDQDPSRSYGDMRFNKSGGGGEMNMLTQMRNAVAEPQALRAVGGSRELIIPGHTPRTASSGGGGGVSRTSYTNLFLEPPASLSHRIVECRLEAQAKEFRKKTFAQYMKENDIFTGDPKVRFDEKRLRTEEESALSKAQSLIGGVHFKHLRMQLKRYDAAISGTMGIRPKALG